VIDEEVFEALGDAPDPSVDTEEACYIKVLDCICKHEDACGSHDPHYPGWVKAGVGELRRVYCIMEDSMGLETRCEKGKMGRLLRVNHPPRSLKLQHLKFSRYPPPC
jgi:hypothetical protein